MPGQERHVNAEDVGPVCGQRKDRQRLVEHDWPRSPWNAGGQETADKCGLLLAASKKKNGRARE